MTGEAADLLTKIRRAGGDVRLVGCDRLKLVAPIMLLPELAERVRAVKPLLLAVLADDTSAAQGDGEGVAYPWRKSLRRTNPRESGERLAVLWGFGVAAALAGNGFPKIAES